MILQGLELELKIHSMIMKSIWPSKDGMETALSNENNLHSDQQYRYAI